MWRIAKFTARASFAAGLSVAASAPAYADCYEDIGCTDRSMMRVDELVQLSCENLWLVRNRIYDENGFCFKTPRGRAAFDNSDCWVNDQNKVKLSAIERHNVSAISEAEAEHGCN